MADTADDLSALKIEREPLDAGGGRWGKWIFLLVVLFARGGIDGVLLGARRD